MMKSNKLKRIFTLVLSTALLISVLTPAALAADEVAAAEESTEAAAEESTELVSPETGKSSVRHRSEAEEPENAIGKDAAVSKALAEAGISAEEAGDITVRVIELKDGTVVYCVQFARDGQCCSSQIDAISGEVLCTNVISDPQTGSGCDRRNLSSQRSNARGDGNGKPERSSDDRSNANGFSRGGGKRDPERSANDRGSVDGSTRSRGNADNSARGKRGGGAVQDSASSL